MYVLKSQNVSATSYSALACYIKVDWTPDPSGHTRKGLGSRLASIQYGLQCQTIWYTVPKASKAQAQAVDVSAALIRRCLSKQGVPKSPK